MPPNGTGVTITNPLVLYRSLVATSQIKSDPVQLRLALHLQKLYEKLIDYEPSIEYSQRLQQLTRAVNASQNVAPPSQSTDVRSIGTRGIWTSLLAQKEKRDSLALTRVLTSYEQAMGLQSPKGLVLHGEVGTGKSMLIDLFAECLPNRKKRRCHFNTFMLDTFSRLEILRKSQLTNSGALQDEYSLLVLARDLIETSPILFLDEFQLPDRAASKILSNLMTSFFQLGGVLIATSNRMPDELAKAAGVEFSRPMGRLSRLGWRLGLGGIATKEDGPGQKGEFAIFLEVLKSRCEVWEMDGKRDYRKIESEEGHSKKEVLGPSPPSNTSVPSSGVGQNSSSTKPSAASEAPITSEEVTLPKNYLILPPPTADQATLSSYDTSLNSILETATSHLHPIPWTPSILTVYGRKLHIPTQYSGVALFTFDQLCGAALGPADYITIASTYHTIILTDIPILTFIQKNEARRLITLLDALYEAKCRLLITAATDPDSLLFPEPVVSAAHNTTPKTEELIDDAVHSETYSEIHQDLTSPFRPNISSYSPGLLAADALEDDPPNRFRRPGTSYTDERKLGAEGAKTPDFTNIRGLTGEDERFAVKRAQSRIWEMCSGRWWDRGASISVEANCMGNENGWWRPLPLSSRHWEHSATSASPSTSTIPPSNPSSQENTSLSSDSPSQDQLFSHDTSPFRTTTDPPPKIAWPHVWGTVKWGKRAGTWGKGVEGLGERKKEKDGDGDADGRSVGNGQEKVKEKEKEKIETSLLDKGRSVGDDDR